MRNRGSFVVMVVSLFLISGCSVLGLGSHGSPVLRATETPTLLPPFTPRPTDTPWPTVVPVTPGVLSGVISSTVNVRRGPGTEYPIVTQLSKGTRVNVRGQDNANQWLFLVPPPNGWVNGSFVSVTGDASSLPVIDAPPPPVPTPTFAPSPTPMPTATPPMYVDFRADAPWVMAGECTTLRWDVEGVRAVYMNGQGQPGHSSQDVCPSETRTYVLHAALNSGYLDRAITIAVLPVPATQVKP